MKWMRDPNFLTGLRRGFINGEVMRRGYEDKRSGEAIVKGSLEEVHLAKPNFLIGLRSTIFGGNRGRKAQKV